MLVSSISLAQTFNFGCDYNTDSLYSTVLSNNTTHMLSIFIQDAERHNYSRSLKYALPPGDRIQLLPYNNPIFYNSDDPNNPIGGWGTWHCGRNDFGVILRANFWNGGRSIVYKLTFLYHELGHALLGLDHSTDVKDIMYPTIPILTYSEFRTSTNRMFSVPIEYACKGVKRYYD